MGAVRRGCDATSAVKAAAPARCGSGRHAKQRRAGRSCSSAARRDRLGTGLFTLIIHTSAWAPVASALERSSASRRSSRHGGPQPLPASDATRVVPLPIVVDHTTLLLSLNNSLPLPLTAVHSSARSTAARGQAAHRHVHRPVEYGREGGCFGARLWRDAGEFALWLGRGVDGSAELDVAGGPPALQPRLWREQSARRHHGPGVAPRAAHRHSAGRLQSDGLDGAGAGAACAHGRDDGAATACRLSRLSLLLSGARSAGGRGAEARGAGPRAARQDDQRPPRSRARDVPRRPARRPIPSGRRGGRAAVGCGAPLWRRADQTAGTVAPLIRSRANFSPPLIYAEDGIHGSWKPNRKHPQARSPY